MEATFTFTAQDCIQMRKDVLKFYKSLIKPDEQIPNVIDEKEPWKDVVSDFQMLIYIYLLMEANREVERAEQVGGEFIRREAKQALNRYKKEYNSIRMYIPMDDPNFVCQYSDVDDALDEGVNRIVQQTYYPLLNNILKESAGIRSEIAQTEAHLITALCFAVISCEKGIIENHKVDSPACRRIGDRICTVAGYTTTVNNCFIKLDEKVLEKAVTDCMNVVTNVAQGTIEAIAEHANSIDLTAYVASADYTKSRFDEIVEKLAQYRKQRMKKAVTTIKHAKK